jgi:hypothetical protein
MQDNFKGRKPLFFLWIVCIFDKNGTFFDCGGIEGVQYFCVMNMNDTLSSGTYFYRLETDMGILVKQMTIIK